MANKHRGIQLVDERELARDERRRKLEFDQKVKLNALKRKFDRRSGRAVA